MFEQLGYKIWVIVLILGLPFVCPCPLLIRDLIVYCMAYQLAETDPKYCEQLASELSKGDNDPPDPWRKLFAERFPSKGDDHAYLILDGIDEMKEDELTFMIKCFDQLIKDDLNIHVLLTGRPSVSEQIEPLSASIIEITRAKLATDIERVITQNIKKLPRLKNFRKPVRLYILSKVKGSADGKITSNAIFLHEYACADAF